MESCKMDFSMTEHNTTGIDCDWQPMLLVYYK